MSSVMDESLKLRISSIFIMFCASMAGVLLPLYYASNAVKNDGASHAKMANSDGFKILRTFAAGIMLGVGFIHLLNDGIGKIAEVQLEYPSLGFTLATIGTLIVLGFEQLALMLISRVEVDDKIIITKDSHKSDAENKHDADCKHLELEVVSAVPNTHQSSCDHTHAINMIAGSDSFGVIIKAYMMEISVAIHSVIIGIALGSLAGPDNLAPLSALLIAICFHQFFEGLGLGTVIEAARMHLGVQKIVIFAVTFALTVPVGVVIGIIITDDNALANGPTDIQNLALGCLNSLAAGIMIYVALVEMIAEDFQHASMPSNSPLRIKMFLAVTAGAAIMAFLAIWA